MDVQPYLEEQDDGLAFRPAGDWARKKLDYLERYVDIVEKSMHTKHRVRNYIDLLAGPGKNLIRGSKRVLLGSPLLALTTRYVFTNYYFVDSDPTYTEALRRRCDASPFASRVRIWTGDCNSVVDEIAAILSSREPDALNIAFLDPEGLELHWKTVVKLAAFKRMDMIINYCESGLRRNLRLAFDKPGDHDVDDFFGDRSWRDVYREYQGRTECDRQLIDFYKGRLLQYGYKEVVGDYELTTEPQMRNTQNAPLYRLLFASKHVRGQDFWQKIVQRDVYGQKPLPFGT
jgi:three-Cys-motif partner protein